MKSKKIKKRIPGLGRIIHTQQLRRTSCWYLSPVVFPRFHRGFIIKMKTKTTEEIENYLEKKRISKTDFLKQKYNKNNCECLHSNFCEECYAEILRQGERKSNEN